MIRTFYSLFVLFLLLSACGPEPTTLMVTVVPTETHTAADIPVSALTPTPTSTSTAAPTPASTLIVTPISTSLPTSIPLPVTVTPTITSLPPGQLALVRDDGLWLVISERNSLRQTRLFEGESINSPRFSPDGRWLLFRQEGQYRLISTADGGVSTMVGEINPNHCVWSPLDSQLACNTRNGGLILYTPADSKIQVVLPSGSGVKSVAWSPDGGWLAFAKRESRDEEAPTYPGLWRVKVDGSEAGEILANSIPAQETLYLAQWTPDGEHILFWRGPCRVSWKDGLPLFRIFVDGGEPVQLPDPALGYDELRATSPNGRWMAIVLGLWRDVSANKQIWLLRADGTPERKLSDEDRSDLWPVWSPDGELLAYVSLPIPPGYEAMETNDPDVSGRRLCVMKNDGSEKKQLTDDPGYADEWPMWGSDGEHLVFVRRSLNRNSSEIWAYNLATYQLSPMVQGPSLPMKHYGYIHWSAVLDWHAGSLDSK